MVEKVEAGVPGAAGPRRSSYPLKRDYDEYRCTGPVLMRLATTSPFGSTPTRWGRRSCPKFAAGDAGHTSEAALPATVETSRDFPACVVK